MLDELATLMKNVSKCAVLTGAGISAESGVPTFRGSEGLWGKFRPEELATMDAFLSNPKLVWEWYNWRRELMTNVRPNAGHIALRELESSFDEFLLITQNVDNLHQLAGSEKILELHGNIHKNRCVSCREQFELSVSVDPKNIASCPKCEGMIRPDVVWFGELLPEKAIQEAFDAAKRCEIFFSVGTSALVQPAASLPATAKQNGATLVEINPEETPLTGMADFTFKMAAGEFLPKLLDRLRGNGDEECSKQDERSEV